MEQKYIFVFTYVSSWRVMPTTILEDSAKWHLFTIKIGTQQGVFKDNYLHKNSVTYSMQYKLNNSRGRTLFLSLPLLILNKYKIPHNHFHTTHDDVSVIYFTRLFYMYRTTFLLVGLTFLKTTKNSKTMICKFKTYAKNGASITKDIQTTVTRTLINSD